MDVVHILGHYETSQDDDNPIDVKNLTVSCEHRKEGLLGSDIIQRLKENFAVNRIWFMTWTDIYKRDFLSQNGIEFHNILAEDSLVHFKALCLAKNYFMFREFVYINRQRKTSISRSPNLKSCSKSIASMPIIASEMKAVMSQFPELSQDKLLQEQCIIQIWESLFRDHARPLYNSANIDAKLDEEVYETMLPIFGENTTLVKYLFHGFNTMWRQANFLAQQVYLLNQRENLLQQQSQLIEQLQRLLDLQDRRF